MLKSKYNKLILIIFLLLIVSCGNDKNKELVIEDTKLKTPIINIQDNILTWDKINNADYYAIFINDCFVETTNTNNYVLENRINGEYNIQVKSCDSYQRFESSDLSESIKYIVDVKELKKPLINITSNVISWEEVEGATSYKIFVDTQWKNKWDVKKHDNLYTCVMNFDFSDSYKINVMAYSNDLSYEKEKSSEVIDYKISIKKIWYNETLLDWSLNGDITLKDNNLLLNDLQDDKELYISNNVLIDENHQYLSLDLEKLYSTSKVVSNEEICLSVNNAIINPTNYNDLLVYDLSSYTDEVVSIKIEQLKNNTLILKGIRLFTNDFVTSMNTWGIYDIGEEWLITGDYSQHIEGFCLECWDNESVSSITNTILVKDLKKLQIAFRIFTRVDGNDRLPLVKVYVNNELIKSIDCENDYVSATTDAYSFYTYDLSYFEGQVVQITIESSSGQHACFGEIKLCN